MVYLASFDSGRWELRAAELTATRETALAQGESNLSQPSSVSLTNDGRLIAFVDLSPPLHGQFVLLRPDGSGRRVIATSDGAVEAVLSGYGNVLYGATQGGRLLRYWIASGDVEELTRTVREVAEQSPIRSAPGSIVTIPWVSFYDRTSVAEPPLPGVLDDWSVWVGERAAPVWIVASDRVLFQLPWETPLGDHVLWVSGPGLAFEPGIPVNVVARYVQSLQGQGQGVAIHADFSAIVSEAHPVRPGDVVHAYLTGVGAVNPTVATGEPAPASPLARSDPLGCKSASGQAVDELFVGLVPGFVGIYQLSFRVPKDGVTTSAGSAATVACGATLFVLPIAR